MNAISLTSRTNNATIMKLNIKVVDSVMIYGIFITSKPVAVLRYNMDLARPARSIRTHNTFICHEI